MSDVSIVLESPNVGNKTCSLLHSSTKEADCLAYLRIWNDSNYNTTCWRVVERSWWFGQSNDNCYEDQPRGPDVFDRALPLICAGVILIVSLYFWVTCCMRRRMDRRRGGRDRERSPLLEEMGGTRPRAQVTDVAQLSRDDGRAAAAATGRVAGNRASAVVTCSAVWLGPTEAAVVLGDAKTGSYPCEVERVYDVSMSTDETCAVCLSEPKQVVMWPCRHMCVCAECAPRLRKCPLCRKPVARRLRLELQPLPGADGVMTGEEIDKAESDSDTSSTTSGASSPRSSPSPAAGVMSRPTSRVPVAEARSESPSASAASPAPQSPALPEEAQERQGNRRPGNSQDPEDVEGYEQLPSPRGPHV